MSAKFFVWGGGRWREVSLAGAGGGSVEGWGRVQFAAAARGRLRLARRGAVLRGLRALAAGKPTTVRDGPPLSQIRLSDVKQHKQERGEGHRHCCCHKYPALLAPRVSNDEIFNQLLKTTANVGIQCGKVDTGVQVDKLTAGTHPTHTHTQQIAYQKNQHESSRKSLKRLRSKSPETRLQANNNTERVKKLRQSENSESSQQKKWRKSPSRADTCKELIIQEEDVELLRRFIQLDRSGFLHVDLGRFDDDDDYKRNVFYKLNPIVNVVRCARIERMLRARRRWTTELSLKDFVSVLGLRSVADSQSEGRSTRTTRVAVQRRSTAVSSQTLSDDIDKEKLGKRSPPPTRDKRTKGVKGNFDTKRNFDGKSTQDEEGSHRRRTNGSINRRKSMVLISDDTDKENLAEQVPRVTKHKRTKVVKDTDNKKKNVDKTSKQDADNTGNNTNVVSENKTEASGSGSGVRRVMNGAVLSNSETVKSSDSKQSVNKTSTSKKKADGPAKVVKPGKLREYSLLEDEAIVRLVQSGSRAHLVNGNRVWKQLQPEYERRTGTFRSWHSLRNRYLRHLLPSLARLLPPTQAAALRAAAATGELKARKLARRNSMFEEERVRSAWSRRPRPPVRTSSPPSSPSPPPKPPTPPTSRSSSQSSRSRTVSSPEMFPSSNDSSSMSTTQLRRSGRHSNIGSQTKATRSTRSSAAGTHTHAQTHTPPRTQARQRGNKVTPTYSEVTRRFASRSSRSASPPRGRSPARKTRRLYNPKDAL